MPPGFASPDLLGALEIGAFLSIFMFGVVVMQGHLYFKNCENDSIFLVLLVLFILCLEFGHAISAVQSVYEATITNADLLDKPGNSYPISICSLLETVITTVVQGYYVEQIRRLSGKVYLAIAGWALTALHLLAGLVLSYESFLDVPREPNNFDFQRNWGWLLTACLALGAMVDILIAATLCYYLKRFATPVTLQTSTQLLNRLLLWVIETGLVTSITSVTVLICFQTMKFNYVWFAVYLSLAKLYSNSLLASLNSRPSHRRKIGLVHVNNESSGSSISRTRSRTASGMELQVSVNRSTPTRRSTISDSRKDFELTPVKSYRHRSGTIITPIPEVSYMQETQV